MDNKFQDKSAKVVVVENSGAARTLLAEVVRGLGFSDVSGLPTIKDAIGVLEVEPVDWLICPVLSDHTENGIALLKLHCSHPSLRPLRISLMVEEGDGSVLPDAFEYGLLSYHNKPFTKDSLKSELSEFLELYEKNHWQSALVASVYLRKHLMEAEKYEDLLNFERRLMNLYPGNVDRLFNLVPPLVKLERMDEAKATLLQIRQMNPGAEDRIKSMIDEYLPGESLEDSGDGTALNFLGVKKILVVDNDDAVRQAAVSILTEMGIPEIVECDNGEDAVAKAKEHQDIEVIIQEWRLPKLTGPLLIQRFQEEGLAHVPVIVFSSLITEQDKPFIKEMGVSYLIKKPLDRSEFVQGLIWTVQQDRAPTDQFAMERKMRLLLQQHKTVEAQEIRNRYLADSGIPIGAKEVIEAEFHLVAKEYERAKELAVLAIKHSGDSIFILNLLGKALMNLRQFEVALKCFQKAQELAPLNIERLCQIAEAHSEMGDTEKAGEILEEASDIDPDSQKTSETAAKVALNAGDTSEAKKIMGQLKAIENVVAYMNNQAVAMARCGMVEEGIQQYQKTKEAIPDGRTDILAIVSFNLGLAFVRNHLYDDAWKELEACVGIGDTKVKEKAAKLLANVKIAVERGVQLRMSSEGKDASAVIDKDAANTVESVGQAESQSPEESDPTVIALVEMKPGDKACHLVYQTTDSSELALKLLDAKLRFNPRQAIERAESGGADRLLASGS